MTDPLWVDPADSQYPQLQGTVEVDVAIVGGGLSGVGAAHALRESGATVVLVEGRTLASGASGRNAGFVLAGPAMPFGQACDLVGPEEARNVWQLTVDNNRLMANLVDEYELDCDYLRRGSMSLAVSEEEMRQLIATADRLTEAGFSACIVPADDLPRPFDRLYAGGIYYPGNGEINPGAFVRGVVHAFNRRLRVYERSPVLELRSGTPHVLVTSTGEIRARTVILATNAYTSTLLLAAPITSVRGQVVASRRLDRVVVPFPMYANYGYQYWRQTSGGRLVAGGWRDLDIPTEVGTEECLHDAIHGTLDAFCASIAGENVAIQYRWAGIMGFTPDALPLVGALSAQPGIYLAAGYSGHGVSMAFMCGARVALQAIGQAAYLPPSLSPDRFVGSVVSRTTQVSRPL